MGRDKEFTASTYYNYIINPDGPKVKKRFYLQQLRHSNSVYLKSLLASCIRNADLQIIQVFLQYLINFKNKITRKLPVILFLKFRPRLIHPDACSDSNIETA